VFFFECFNIFKKDIGFFIELVTLGFDIENFLVIFVPEILVLLSLFYKFPGLVVESVLRSRANLLALAFSSLRRFLCSSDSARIFFLFSIRSFNMRYNSSSDSPLLIEDRVLWWGRMIAKRIRYLTLLIHSYDNSAHELQGEKHQKR
jgi:hypothetical protein